MSWTLVFATILTVGGIFHFIPPSVIPFISPEDTKEVEHINYAGRLVYSIPGPMKINLYDESSVLNHILCLSCKFEVYNYSNTEVEWILKRNDNDSLVLDGFSVHVDTNNETQLVTVTTHYQRKLSSNSFDEQNGTYVCRVWDSFQGQYLIGKTDVILYAPTKVTIGFAKAISPSKIYLNWTLNTYNSHIQGLYLAVLNDSIRSPNAMPPRTIYIDETKNNYIVSDLESGTIYRLALVLETKAYRGDEIQYHNSTSNVIAKTLPKDFTLQPTISVRSVTTNSIGIQISDPPSDVAELIHCYELQLWKDNNPMYITTVFHTEMNEPYIFTDLNQESAYIIRARALFDIGIDTLSGNWSEEIRAETFSIIPGKPSDVQIDCNKTGPGYIMNLTWAPPKKPGEIFQYKVRITANGTSTSTVITSNETFALSLVTLPNTRYTVRLWAVSPLFQGGRQHRAKCWTGDPNREPTFYSDDHYLKLLRHLRRFETEASRGNPFSAHRSFMKSLNITSIFSSASVESYEMYSEELPS